MIKPDRRTSLMWCISLAFLVPGFPVAERRDGGVFGAAPGIHWLSLPVSLLPGRDPLEGWDSLPAMREERQIVGLRPPLPEPAPVQPPVEVLPQRLQVYGSIFGGGGPVYCFHDRIDQRWFRLAAGEVDMDSGIRLSKSGAGGLLVIEDLGTGQIFSFEPGEWRILPEQHQP